MMDANQQGIGMVFQEQSLISNLSVAQNIYLGREKDFARGGFINWGAMNKSARKVLDAMGLQDINVKTKVRDISFAMRQMVEITKVFDIVSETANNRALILLDEPTTVLSDAEMKVLFDKVRQMKEMGNSIIFISHRLQEVLEITDRIYVFKDGYLTAEVGTKEASEAVLYEKMVGRETNGEYYVSARQTVPTDDVVLEAENLCMFGSFKDVSFKLHKGEVFRAVRRGRLRQGGRLRRAQRRRGQEQRHHPRQWPRSGLFLAQRGAQGRYTLRAPRPARRGHDRHTLRL